MKRHFRLSTLVLGLGAVLATTGTIGTLVQGGWHDYMLGFLALCFITWWLVWLSTNPKED